MIAAGSLFTSCVENTEPQGIKDLRLAKADYLDALSNLRAADAEKVKAEATLVQAKAAVQQAVAAKEQAAAKLAEANAKAKEIENDKTAADNEIALAKAKADAEAYVAQQELVLAQAEEALRAYLVKVEEQSKQLTWAEQQIVWAYTAAYNKVIAKQKAVREAEEDLYDVTYDDYGVNEVEAAIAAKESEIARAEASINRAIAKYDEYEKKAEEEIAKYDVWAAEYQKLQDSVEAYEYVKADLKKAAEIAKIEDKEAFDAFYAEVKKAEAAVTKAVGGVKDFSMVYIRDKKNAFVLPEENAFVPVVKVFEDAVSGIDNDIRISVDPAVIGDNTTPKRVLSINITGANAKDVAESFIFGDEENPDAASLAGIIDALKRDSVVVDKLLQDSTGIAAAVAKVKAEYAAVKDTLEKGRDAYEPIAKAQAKADSLKNVYTTKNTAFAADTADLFKAIRTFLAAENTNYKYNELRKSDSLEVWNAFIDVMKLREKVFDKEKAPVYFYYKKGFDGDKIIAVEDSVKFSELEFSGIQVDADGKSLYGGYEVSGTDGPVKFGNAFNMILTKAVGGEFYAKTYSKDEKPFQSNATFEDLLAANATDNLRKLFFGNYWRNPADGKITEMDGEGAGKYVSEAVKKAKDEADDAKLKVETARNSFYTNIYQKFWGKAFHTSADSLKINYSEKTYAGLPVFSAASADVVVYNSADSTFNFEQIKYNENNAELKLIAQELKQNNIKVVGATEYTLFAKVIAAEQIATLAANWKNNTQALAEIEKAVAAVEAAYEAAVLKVVESAAAADAAVTEFLGEDIVKAHLKEYEVKTATALWNKAKSDLVVNNNVDDFCLEGEYTFGGLQLAAAEKWIPDYAKDVYSHHIVMESIKAAQEDCQALSNIINEYAKEIAKLDKNYRWGSAADIDAAVVAKWNWFLGNIESEINNLADQKAKAEAALAKIEAGYSTEQANIDSAKEALAKAEQALEQAEVEFGIAKEAYETVLANHGIAE